MIKIKRNIVTPFCIFFIIMGTGGVVLLPMIHAVFNYTDKTYQLIFDITWYAGAIMALLYSVVELKDHLKHSFGGKIMYYFLALIFIGLLFVPHYRH